MMHGLPAWIYSKCLPLPHFGENAIAELTGGWQKDREATTLGWPLYSKPVSGLRHALHGLAWMGQGV